MQTLPKMTGLIHAAAALAALAAAPTPLRAATAPLPPPEQVSDEDVPVALTQPPSTSGTPATSLITCHDYVPDRGYGPIPGGLLLAEAAVFDRTLRIAGFGSLSVELPQDVTCASLETQLDAVGDSLTANRKLVRTFSTTLDGKRLVTTLEATFAVKLPVQVAGAPVTLTGTVDWLEDNAPASPGPVLLPQFPLERQYDAHIYPQSGSNGIGLFCTPQYEGAVEQNLTLGEANAFNDYEGAFANVDVVAKPFDTLATCDDVRTDLLDKFQAADPGNWGSIIKVTRTVESTTRYILDNQGNPACQRIELESLVLTTEAQTFRASKSFPVQTVDLAVCFE